MIIEKKHHWPIFKQWNFVLQCSCWYDTASPQRNWRYWSLALSIHLFWTACTVIGVQAKQNWIDATRAIDRANCSCSYRISVYYIYFPPIYCTCTWKTKKQSSGRRKRWSKGTVHSGSSFFRKELNSYSYSIRHWWVT